MEIGRQAALQRQMLRRQWELTAGDAERWPDGLKALTELVAVADDALSAGEADAGKWGPWCAALLLHAAQGIQTNEGPAGLTRELFGRMCDSLDKDGALLEPIERAARAGLVACEATRARWFARALASWRPEYSPPELVALQEADPELANAWKALTTEILQLELDVGREYDPGFTEAPRTAANLRQLRTREMQARRTALRRRSESLLKRIRELDGLSDAYPPLPDFGTLQAAVPNDGAALVPVIAPKLNAGWTLILTNAVASIAPMPPDITWESLEEARWVWEEATRLYSCAVWLGKGSGRRVEEATSVAMNRILAWLWYGLAGDTLRRRLVSGTSNLRRIWWVPTGPLASLPVGMPPAMDGQTLWHASARSDSGGPTTGGPSQESSDSSTSLRMRDDHTQIGCDDRELNHQLADLMQRVDALVGSTPNTAAPLDGFADLPTSHLGNLALLRRDLGQRPSAKFRVVTMGVRCYPEDGRHLTILHGAQKEAQKVADCYPTDQVTRPLLGQEATADALHEALVEATVVHVSCHGRLHPEHPDQSALELYDASVTLGEIVARLRDRSSAPAHLAVLSACHSNAIPGPGGGDGLTLATCMHLAGYTHAIGSLHAVPDRHTTEIMPVLHRHLSSGDDPAAALRKALMWAQTQWPNAPVAWATWTHTGV